MPTFEEWWNGPEDPGFKLSGREQTEAGWNAGHRAGRESMKQEAMAAIGVGEVGGEDYYLCGCRKEVEALKP